MTENNGKNAVFMTMLFNMLNQNISVISEMSKTLESVSGTLTKLKEEDQEQIRKACNREEMLIFIKRSVIIIIALLVILIVSMGTDIGWVGELIGRLCF